MIRDIPILHCCPLCSVMPPGDDPPDRGMISACFVHPSLNEGRHTGRFWLMRRIGCNHGPIAIGPHEDPVNAALTWNDWAEQEAAAKAQRLAFTPRRTELWRHYLGITPHPALKR